MFLEIIIENEESQPASLEEIQEWADTYSMTMPVLSDANSTVLYTFASGSIGLPYTVLLDRGVVVESVGSASVSQMDELLGE